MRPANWSRRLRVGTLIAAGTASSVVILSAVAAPAGAGTGPSSGEVAVPQGVTAASLHGTRISAAPTATRETISFVLKLQNAGALKTNVQRGMPYGWLPVRTFANRYGQSLANVAALERYLKRYGIKSTAYADRLDISTTGTVAQYGKALSVRTSLYRLHAVRARGAQAARPAVVVTGTADKPLLPARLAKFVYAILGLTTYPVASSNAVHTLTPEQHAGPRGIQVGNRTPASFAGQYGLTSLYKKGFRGQGETIGIITYASLKPSDATHFWTSVLKIKTKADRIKLDNVDGGSGAATFDAGSNETALDVEQSGALAPQANIVVYQAPNTDYGSADAWFTAASQDTASSVSTSWGESEILNQAIGANGTEAATYGGIFDEAGLEMAAQGQSAFDASGDAGAYDDVGDPTAYTNLSVDNPANSPWITAVGGTTNQGLIPIADSQGVLSYITIPRQRAWGWDYLWPDYATLSYVTGDTTEAQLAADPTEMGGSGGGYSLVERRPAYQSAIANIGEYRAVPYLAPDTSADVLFGTKTSCTGPVAKVPCVPTAWTTWADGATAPVPAPHWISGSAAGRAVPDIAADADPYTGYEVYFSGFPAAFGGTLEDGWGGTSFVAPQLAGSAAVIDSYLHHRAGFWNPLIYKFAAHSYTPFVPLDASGAHNDNLYYTGTADHIYNPGTGLGTPNLGKLALDFKYHS
ncbi:MAG TPA: S53 family peptidase [Streptosporangiaceae bacterium]